MSPIRIDFSAPSGNVRAITNRMNAQITPKTSSATMGRSTTAPIVTHMRASMPEDERDVGYDAEEDGPMWDEGRDLMGEADFADFLDDEVVEDDDE